MTRYWPKRAAGLPPGQRLLTLMPRFSDRPLLPPPSGPAAPALDITLEGNALARVTGETLEGLGLRDVAADFHCVTTWSVTGLVWRGVPLREVLAAVGIIKPRAPYVVARGADGYWTALVWEDATAEDVLLATHLNGAPLDGRHGAPLRLVSPSQYGYKNVKHLASLDFRREQPRAAGKQHLRARVGLEERHQRLPAWAVRLPYRTLIGPTVRLSERTLDRATARLGS